MPQTTTPLIHDYFDSKYGKYSLVAIELVPDSYLQDPLDNSDVSIRILVNQKYIIENFSLKAIRKSNSKLTLKNPGGGTILSEQYFNIQEKSYTTEKIKEVQEYYDTTEDRKGSLEKYSDYIGYKLQEATQEQLVNGIQSLLGYNPIIICYYFEKSAKLSEVGKVEGTVVVKIATPTSIQNTIEWDNGGESIFLRVKFSRGKKHGWSSLKFTAEYIPK